MYLTINVYLQNFPVRESEQVCPHTNGMRTLLGKLLPHISNRGNGTDELGYKTGN